MVQSWGKYYKHLAGEGAMKKVMEVRHRNLYSIEMLKKYIRQIDPAILGNPDFLHHLSYTQDKAIVLREALSKNFKNIIQKFAAAVLKTWEYGFCEITFNFTINYGLREKAVILCDLGELTFSKDEIKKLIRRNEWIWSASFKELTPDQQEYFEQTCNHFFTIENLNLKWKKRVISLARTLQMSET